MKEMIDLIAASKGVHVQSCAGKPSRRGHSYLVRGAGKRAILVAIGPFHGSSRLDEADRGVLAKVGALYAAHRGWKKVVLEPDMGDGETVEAYHPGGGLLSQSTYGSGAYLCTVDEVKEFTDQKTAG